MRYVTTAVALAILTAFTVGAQEEEASPPTSTLTVSAYGTMAAQVLDDVAAKLEARLQPDEDLRTELETTPVWLVCENTEAEDTLEVLGSQLRMRIEWDREGGVLRLREVDDAGGVTKGYDVSVLTGRYVEYINSYGGRKGDKSKEKSPATRWADLVEDTVCPDTRASIVGDRVLFTETPRRHNRVREFLNLMIEEGGGESADLKREREVIRKLKETEVSAAFQARPLASAFAALCKQAGVPCFMEWDLRGLYTDEHVDAAFEGVSAYEALQSLVKQHGSGGNMIGVRNGFVFATSDADALRHSYRVIDVSDLLRKLDTAYNRQQTALGKEGGFRGSLSEDGGVEVILRALRKQLEANRLDNNCEAYGERIVVLGGHKVVDAAVEVLKEMGWEEPGADEAAEAGHAE